MSEMSGFLISCPVPAAISRAKPIIQAQSGRFGVRAISKTQSSRGITDKSGEPSEVWEGIRGRVLAIRPDRNLVIATVGKNTGLKQEMRGVVYREGKLLGWLEISEIMPELSTAKIVGSGPIMQQGDEVVFRAP